MNQTFSTNYKDNLFLEWKGQDCVFFNCASFLKNDLFPPHLYNQRNKIKLKIFKYFLHLLFIAQLKIFMLINFMDFKFAYYVYK